jgi:hypothetical protein
MRMVLSCSLLYRRPKEKTERPGRIRFNKNLTGSLPFSIPWVPFGVCVGSLIRCCYYY